MYVTEHIHFDGSDLMSSVGKRIRETRQIKGISQQELAETIGVKQPAISQLEKGSTKMTQYLDGIAARLQVNPYWLKTGLGPRDLDTGEGFSNRKVPLVALKRVSRLNRIDVQDDAEWIFCPFEDYGPKTYATIVKDDSMLAGMGERSLYPGDYVFVDPERAYQPDDFVLVVPVGSHHAKIRRCVERDGQQYLYASNPAEDNPYTLLDRSFRVLGTVIAVMQKF